MNGLCSYHIFLLAMEENYMVQKLSFLRDFFLLGLGELFFGFINEISTGAKQLNTGIQTNLLNKCFLEAVKKTSSFSSAIYSLNNISDIHFYLDQKSTFYGASTSGEVSWGGIQIKYQIDGLLSFFITEKELGV
eukprot:TRINITY_DN389_c0_g1_i8.p3 TRINITY_DN389_c0_g1~~TRINITY_DN389_c0_g1_i8.p3  ORF type:complete len:134 (+),score=16.83 TRINITY_DN389_c0_g1_i8:927-1328(+)